MRRKSLIRRLIVLAVILVLALVSKSLPTPEAGHGPEQMALACDCGDRCDCDPGATCCTGEGGSCGIAEREHPLDEKLSAFKPLPPMLLALGWLFSRSPALALRPSRVAEHPAPFLTLPDPPPRCMG